MQRRDTEIPLQVAHIALSPDCQSVFNLSSTLSLEGEIRAWSIWRGYFLAMVDQYSIDDFIFVSTLLQFAWSLYVLWPIFRSKLSGAGWCFSRRRPDDDGYFPIAQDLEVANDNKEKT